MKPLLIFVKSTIVGGLLFLVPLVVLVVVIAKAFYLAHRLAQPVASMLRVGSVAGVILSDLIAIASLVLFCFLAGLVARWSFASRWVGKADARLLWGVPAYGFLKSVVGSLDGHADQAAMRPVLAHLNDLVQLAFEIDDLTDGRKVVFLPNAPDPKTGRVAFIAADRIEPLPITAAAAFMMQRRLGRGAGALLGAASCERSASERVRSERVQVSD